MRRVSTAPASRYDVLYLTERWDGWMAGAAKVYSCQGWTLSWWTCWPPARASVRQGGNSSDSFSRNSSDRKWSTARWTWSCPCPSTELSPQTGSTELSQLSSFALPFILYSLDYLVKFISFSEQETEFHFKCNLRRKVCCCWGSGRNWSRLWCRTR